MNIHPGRCHPTVPLLVAHSAPSTNAKVGKLNHFWRLINWDNKQRPVPPAQLSANKNGTPSPHWPNIALGDKIIAVFLGFGLRFSFSKSTLFTLFTWSTELVSPEPKVHRFRARFVQIFVASFRKTTGHKDIESPVLSDLVARAF